MLNVYCFYTLLFTSHNIYDMVGTSQNTKKYQIKSGVTVIEYWLEYRTWSPPVLATGTCQVKTVRTVNDSEVTEIADGFNWVWNNNIKRKSGTWSHNSDTATVIIKSESGETNCFSGDCWSVSQLFISVWNMSSLSYHSIIILTVNWS